jgi:hypothetical protein
MAAESYEVTEDEVTILKTVSRLPQADGSYVYQNGMGKVYLKGEVIPASEVAEDWKEALDSGEGDLYESLKDKLKESGDDPQESSQRLGLPFTAYDEMETNDIVSVMRSLPSATIQRIKEYESQRGDEARLEIVDFNIGYGETPHERQLAEPEEPEDGMDENKAVRKLTTREVPDEGPVVPGEGFTGTGDPQKPYGVEKDAEEGDETAKATRKTSKGHGDIASARRGRRERQPKPPPGEGEGGTSLASSNE